MKKNTNNQASLQLNAKKLHELTPEQASAVAGGLLNTTSQCLTGGRNSGTGIFDTNASGTITGTSQLG